MNSAFRKSIADKAGLPQLNPGLDLLTEALTLYHEQNLDFADALVATVARRKGPPVVYSFDRDFDRVAGLTRLTPGSQKV